MADVGAGPTETPRGDKRVVRDYETPITGPAAKAQRTEAASSGSSGGGSSGGGSSLSQALAQLQAAVAAVKSHDPSTLDDAQSRILRSAVGQLALFSGPEQRRRKAAREAEQLQPVVEETPLPFDLLVHTLTYLPTTDLAAAAKVSRHFNRAIPAVVEQRLKRILPRFKLGYDQTYCSELLQCMEDDFKLAMKGIQTMKPAMTDEDFDKVLNQLSGMDKQVIVAVNEDLWSKADALPGERQSDLLHLLNLARVPQDELVKHLDSVVRILSDHEGETCLMMSALGIMRQMPVVVIERHLREVMWWATSHEQSCEIRAETALDALARLPIETLRRAKVEAELAASPLATSDDRRNRDTLAKLLKSIRSA